MQTYRVLLQRNIVVLTEFLDYDFWTAPTAPLPQLSEEP
jgi:hypothetical protein